MESDKTPIYTVVNGTDSFENISVSTYNQTISDDEEFDNNSLELESKSYPKNSLIPWQQLYETDRINQEYWLSTATKGQKLLREHCEWPIMIISSLCIALLTLGLDWSSSWLNNLKYGVCKNGIFNVKQVCEDGNWITWSSLFKNGTVGIIINWTIATVFSLFFGVIGIILALKFSNVPKSGISEVIMIISGYMDNEFLQWKVILDKFISLIFVLGSGVFVGYEGPLVHISCGVIQFVINRLCSISDAFKSLKNEAVKREVLATGVAIGISLAFGTPIGGLMFAVENLKSGFMIGKLMWNGFVCSMIGVSFLLKLHPFREIRISESFTVGIENNWIFIEILPYILVGLICGILSILFNRFHIKIVNWRLNFIKKTSHKIIEFLIIVLMTHILTYPLSFASDTIPEILINLFYDCSPSSSSIFCKNNDNPSLELSYFVLVSFSLTCYTYATCIPGGILLPSLTIGASIGRIVGELVQQLQFKYPASSIFAHCYNESKQCISPGSYALVGAASMFAGVTNTSVAAAVLVFELTGAVTYLIPLMLGVFIARVVNDVFAENKSIYELWLISTKKEYLVSNLEDTMNISELSIKTADEIISNNKIIYIDNLVTISELWELSRDEIDGGLVILQSKEEPKLFGWISWFDVNEEVEKSKNNGISINTLVNFTGNEEGLYSMNKSVINVYDLTVVNPKFSLLTVYEIMDRLKLRDVFVCSIGSNYYRGVIHKKDMVQLIH